MAVKLCPYHSTDFSSVTSMLHVFTSKSRTKANLFLRDPSSGVWHSTSFLPHHFILPPLPPLWPNLLSLYHFLLLFPSSELQSVLDSVFASFSSHPHLSQAHGFKYHTTHALTAPKFVTGLISPLTNIHDVGWSWAIRHISPSHCWTLLKCPHLNLGSCLQGRRPFVAMTSHPDHETSLPFFSET